jgi:hypothetical protein
MSQPKNPAPAPVAAGEASQVEVKFVGHVPERPPRARALFDVMLRNGGDQPAWFVLPDRLDAQAPSCQAVEVYQLGPVVVGHCYGPGGRFLVRLPAHGSVTLHQVPLIYTGQAPASARFSAARAQSVLIGNEPIEGWFGRDPMSPSHADVSAAPLADQKEVVAARNTPGRTPVPLVLVGAQPLERTVPLH